MEPFIFLWSLGPTELIIILIIVILLFGARKIPDLLKGLGKGIREFKEASKGVDPDAPQIQQPKAEEKKDDANK